MKRFLSVCLALLMVCTTLPMSAVKVFATEMISSSVVLNAEKVNQSTTTISIERDYEEHMVGSTFAISAAYSSDTYSHNENTINYEIIGNDGGLILDGSMSCVGTKEQGIVSVPLKAVNVGTYTFTFRTIDGATDSITIVVSNESYDVYLAQGILERNSFLTTTDTIIKSSDYGWMQSNEAMIYFDDLKVQEYVETMIIRILVGKAIDEKNIFESYAKATSLVTQCMSGIKGIYSTITEETTFDSINDEFVEKNIKDYVSGFYKFNVFDTLSATIKGSTTISQAVKQASYYRVISDTLSVEEISNMLSVTVSSIYESEYRNTLVAAFSNIIDIIENTDLKISEHFADTAIDYGVNTLKSLTLGVAKAFAFNSLNAVAPGLGSIISAGMTVYEICKSIDNLSKNKLEAVEINLSAVSVLCEVFKNAITSYASNFENNPDEYARIIVENYKYLLTADRIAVEIQQDNIDILSKSLLDSASIQPAFSLSQLLKNLDLYGSKSNPLYSRYLINERYPGMLDTLKGIIDNEYIYVKTVTEDYLYYSYGMDLYEYTSDLWDIETKYIITLDPNYSDENNSFKKEFVYYTEGETLDARCMPFLRPGYDFIGWYTDKECTEEYDLQKSIQSNFTLYAKWNKQISYRTNDDGTATVTGLHLRQSNFSNIRQSKEVQSETVLSKINETEAIIPLFVDGKSIVSIDSNAISSNCGSVYIPETIENIATDAIGKSTVIYGWSDSYAHQFAKYNGYKFVSIDKTEETPTEYFAYVIKDDEVTITGLVDGYNPTALNIPSKIENKNVTKIGAYAFENCKSITSITIPNSVTSIGRNAFYGTEYYENSDNWSDAVLYIGKYLIEAKETVNYNYVVKAGTLTIADEAFYSCTNLSNLIIADSTISIGKKSIYYCSNLTNLSIPCSAEVAEDGILCRNISNITITKGTGIWANHKGYNGEQPWNREGCTVTLEEGVESIGDQAFRYCRNLIEITIPNSVTCIGDLAFFDCDNLRKVIFPKNNKIKIGHEAFAYCDELRDITLYSNNIDISDTAFSSCENIESINLSDNVISINGDFAFQNLKKTNYFGSIEQWAKIKFGSKGSNPTFYSKNLYINDELISEIEINNVTKINPYAFCNCTNFKKCTIGNNIISIGEAAFEGCSSLEEITLPFVGYSATDTIASAYTHFGYIFGFEICYDDDYHYRGYTPNDDYIQRFRYNIPETLKSVTITGGEILSSAFRKCETLTNITLPNDLIFIESSTFYGCTNLVSIVIPDSVTNIGTEAFKNCSSLQSVALPCSVESSWQSFSSCNNVKTVTLTKGTGLMRDNCYSGWSWPWCSSDEFEVYVEEGVTNIGGMTFVQGNSLVNIYLSDTVKSINYQAFAGCSNLKEIDLCNVYSIGSDAFSSCTKLEDIKIPNTILKICSGAFKNTYYYNNESNWENGALYIDDCLIEVRDYIGDKYIVKQELKIIAQDAFANCDCSIIIGDFEFKPVNESAFAITNYMGNVSDLIIPDKIFGYVIPNIKEYAFHNCTFLESVTIPNSVIEIAPYAFECCSNLTEIIVSPENTSYCSVDGVLFNKEKTTLLRYPSAKADKSYAIPDSVTDIAETAFFDCESLECLTISEHVKIIASPYYNGSYVEGGAFRNNLSLKKVIWNAEKCYITDSDKYTDPESPEYDPYVAISNVFSFFPNCTELVVGETVQYIPCTILANNQKIESVTIPDSVIRVQPCAFYNCKNLKSVTIGNIANIGFCAFEDCTSLSDVTIGNGVMDIGYAVFRNCTGITEITIPNSVKNIDNSAFNSCWNLCDVYYPGTHEEWEAISIGESNHSLTNAHIHYNTTENHYEFVETVNATCTEDGYNKYTCPCGYEKREIIPALGHIGEIVETVPPTCTSDGYTKYICSVCGEEYKTDWVWAEGHTKGEVVEVVPPTCTSNGYTIYKCTVCGEEFESDWTDLEEHSYELFESRPATCTETGCDIYKCISCDDIKYVPTKEALGHSFENDVCTQCGMLKSDCLESDHEYANNEDKTWILTKPGAQSVAVTFSSDTFVERGYDYIYIYDANDALIGKYTGDELAGKQIVILGDTVKIRLTSDSSSTRFGFALSNVETNITQTFDSEGILVTEGKIGDFSSNTILKVENLEAEQEQVKYDISLIKDGVAVQPTAPVTVKIPVPATMDGTNCKVYRQETDGTYTDMNAVYQDGYMVFTTDHFSVYILTTGNSNVQLGDIDGNGEIDDWDSILLDRYLAGWDVEINTSAADMDGNGVVEDWDGILLARKLAGWN